MATTAVISGAATTTAPPPTTTASSSRAVGAPGSSWAADVNAHREAKRHVVPGSDGGNNYERRAYRDSRYNKQEEYRQYDVVVQQHRDPVKEAENKGRELSKSAVLRQQAKEQSLRYEYKWDVVSHQPKDIGVVDVPRRRMTKAVPAPDRYITHSNSVLFQFVSHTHRCGACL
jgi:hypothetical protein